MGSAARPRHWGGHPRNFRGCPPGGAWVALSRPAPPPQARPDRGRMEAHRKSPAGALLQTDAKRPQTTEVRRIALEPYGRSHRAGHASRRRDRIMSLWHWITRRRQEERELDEELSFHLAEEERLRRDRGQDPALARRDFGNLALTRERTRETWGWAALERIAKDVRYAFRMLRK